MRTKDRHLRTERMGAWLTIQQADHLSTLAVAHTGGNISRMLRELIEAEYQRYMHERDPLRYPINGA